MSTGGPAFEVYGDIGLDTSGVEQKVEKLKALMDKVATSINSTQAAISAGTASPAAIDRLQRLADIYTRLDDQLVHLQSTNSVLNASMAATSGGAQQAAGGWNKFGQTILTVGQIADDAQYGQRGGRAA